MTKGQTGNPAAYSYAQCRCELAASGLMRVRVAGELDACSVSAVESELQSALTDYRGVLVLDLADLQYIDSTGIRLLVYWLRQTHERGGEVVLVTPQALCARRAIDLVGLTRAVRSVASFSEVAPHLADH